MNFAASGREEKLPEGNTPTTFYAYAADEPPSHLLVILEAHPAPYAAAISLPSLLSTLLLLINAHLSLSHQNTASVIGATPFIAKFLHPTSPAQSVVQPPQQPTAMDHPDSTMMYRAFNLVKTNVTQNLQSLLAQPPPSKRIPEGTQLAGALSLALTYINRLQINAPLNPPSARILILSSAGNAKGQYIPIMNSIFAAQKGKVPVDVVRISSSEEREGGMGEEGTFLQQASFTTGGVYTVIKPGMMDELPQYLLQLYAADQAARHHLVFPKRYYFPRI